MRSRPRRWAAPPGDDGVCVYCCIACPLAAAARHVLLTQLHAAPSRLSIIFKKNDGLSSFRKQSESAFRPLMSFGELNDNIIKGLMFYLRCHEQWFICISLCVLSHVSRNRIKDSLLLKVKHVVMRNEKQVFKQWQYTVSIHGLRYLKNMWDIK